MMESARAAFDELAAWFHTDAGKAVFAGAAGGLVRWITLRENWRDGLGSLLVGGLCAVFLWPLAAPLLRPVVGVVDAGESVVAFSAFVVGLGGIGLSGFVIDVLRRSRARLQADASAAAPGGAVAPPVATPAQDAIGEGVAHDR